MILARESKSAAAVAAAVQAAGGTVKRSHGPTGIMVVDGLSAASARTLQGRADVGAIARDIRADMLPPAEAVALRQQLDLSAPRAAADPSDAVAFESYQWYLRQIRADDAWKVTNQGGGALVCILDSGVDPGHPDLAGKVDLDRSVSFVDSEPFIEDLDSHGTAVASLVATNGIVMASVAPEAELCVVKVLDKEGNGSFIDIFSGILYAADVSADVVNMSFGAYIPLNGNNGADRGELRRAILAIQAAVTDYARARGSLLIAAGGNESRDFTTLRDSILLPAQFKDVIAVGSTAPTNQQNFYGFATYTNTGARGIDLYAPGGDLVEGGVPQDLMIVACSRYAVSEAIKKICRPSLPYLLGAGTSFSAPLASATAAIVEGQQRGNTTPLILQACLLAGRDRLPTRLASGRVVTRTHLNTFGAAYCQPKGPEFASRR
jgi:subtilisin family serine protease